MEWSKEGMNLGRGEDVSGGWEDWREGEESPLVSIFEFLYF